MARPRKMPGDQVYRFDKSLDEQTRANMGGQFELESTLGIVREATFKKRLNAQIARRKKMFGE